MQHSLCFRISLFVFIPYASAFVQMHFDKSAAQHSYSFIFTIALSLLVKETKSYTCAIVSTNVPITQWRLILSLRQEEIRQLRNYAITQLWIRMNTNVYECIRSKHKFVFIRNDNCVISEALFFLVEKTRSYTCV